MIQYAHQLIGLTKKGIGATNGQTIDLDTDTHYPEQSYTEANEHISLCLEMK